MLSEATKKTSLGGALVPHHKNTANMETSVMPIPKQVRILMSQHIGAPCEPIVSVGDHVRIGQVIAESAAFISAPIHASVSGKISEISDFLHQNGRTIKGIVIDSDGKSEIHESVVPHEVKEITDIAKFAKAAGLVGLGGASFPTQVKLSPADANAIDSVIINAAECEPYLTSDYREMIENTESVVDGILQVAKLFPNAKTYIGIESNKPEAISIMEKEFKGNKKVEVVALRARYPQGAEKVLAYECIGRMIPEGGLPTDIGAVIINVTTISTLSKYIRTGMPVVKRRITIDGSSVNNPMNIEAPVGTMISELIEFAGGLKGKPGKLILGGPMMGNAVSSSNYSTLKATGGILVFDEDISDMQAGQTPCMRCGSCADACPLNLLPMEFERAVDKENVPKLRKIAVNLCMECGTCSFVCPAKRDLVAKIRKGKAMLTEKK